MRTAVKKKKAFKKSRKEKANLVPDVESVSPSCQEVCGSQEQSDGCQDRCQQLERANASLVSAITEQCRNALRLQNDFYLARKVIGEVGECATDLQNYVQNYMEMATGMSINDITNARNLNAVPAGIKDIDATTFIRAMHRVLTDLDRLVALKDLGN